MPAQTVQVFRSIRSRVNGTFSLVGTKIGVNRSPSMEEAQC
jgi:hypothetical protein